MASRFRYIYACLDFCFETTLYFLAFQKGVGSSHLIILVISFDSLKFRSPLILHIPRVSQAIQFICSINFISFVITSIHLHLYPSKAKRNPPCSLPTNKTLQLHHPLTPLATTTHAPHSPTPTTPSPPPNPPRSPVSSASTRQKPRTDCCKLWRRKSARCAIAGPAL